EALRPVDRRRTLTQLEKDDWGEPPYDSYVVTQCHRLRHVPLQELTVENLRLLVGQNISLRYTVPLALEQLSRDPMVSGDFYPGDLLEQVRRVPAEFWAEHPRLAEAWERIRASLPR
ncbi:MAG TPA: contact-dependent growth inhibition system immunity protein, partial [Burkholderiales bacterium]